MRLAVIAVFLPLFPLSVVHNWMFARLHAPLMRAALLVLWPQLGVTLLSLWQPEIPPFVIAWAVLSAGFYALRLLTVRDLALWAALLASSALALTWGLAASGADEAALRWFVLWFSLPLALTILLTGPLVRRLGAAYTGLIAGLAHGQPRLAVVLTVLVLGAIATPPFPGFFALLNLLRGLGNAAALGVLGIWLMWGWAATRVVQDLLGGHDRDRDAGTADLGRLSLVLYVAALALFAAAGLQFAGGGL